MQSNDNSTDISENSTEIFINTYSVFDTFENILKGKAEDYSVGLNETIELKGFAGLYFRTPTVGFLKLARCEISVKDEGYAAMAIEVPFLLSSEAPTTNKKLNVGGNAVYVVIYS